MSFLTEIAELVGFRFSPIQASGSGAGEDPGNSGPVDREQEFVGLRRLDSRCPQCRNIDDRSMRALLFILLSLVPLSSVYSGNEVPAVFLNHFALVIDQASYDVLKYSADVAALANAEESHAVSGSQNWTGFYIFGRHTYIELFGSASAPEGQHLGDYQLNLSVEELGGVRKIEGRLSPVFGKRVEVWTMPRSTPSGENPWITGVDLSSPGTEAMSTAFMEIDAGYLAAMHPGAKIKKPLSREDYQALRFLPDRSLDDVVGVIAALNPTDTTQLATELELVGWAVQRGGGGFVATGPDVKLTVVPASARAGIQQAGLRLRHSVPKQEITLGTAKLFLEGETGRFVFW